MDTATPERVVDIGTLGRQFVLRVIQKKQPVTGKELAIILHGEHAPKFNLGNITLYGFLVWSVNEGGLVLGLDGVSLTENGERLLVRLLSEQLIHEQLINQVLAQMGL